MRIIDDNGLLTASMPAPATRPAPTPLPLNAFRDAVHVTGIGTGIGTDMADLPVGAVLRGHHHRDQRSVADLTGVGATDASVAGAVWSLLG